MSKSSTEREWERHFVHAGCAIFIGAAIGAFGDHWLGASRLSGKDVQLFGLSAASLVFNLRSWRHFVEFLSGRGTGLRAFVLLKSIGLALLLAVLVLGKMRGAIIFLLSLVLFLFSGGALILRRERGN